MSQGVIKTWIEIITANAEPGSIKEWDISPKPPEEFQVRVCVLNCEDVETMDFEGTTDAFCRGYFDNKDVQETETHFRCTDGRPDFQYRLIYKVQVPRKDYRYTLQIYDKDFFKSNDIIGEI